MVESMLAAGDSGHSSIAFSGRDCSRIATVSAVLKESSSCPDTILDILGCHCVFLLFLFGLLMGDGCDGVHTPEGGSDWIEDALESSLDRAMNALLPSSLAFSETRDVPFLDECIRSWEVLFFVSSGPRLLAYRRRRRPLARAASGILKLFTSDDNVLIPLSETLELSTLQGSESH